MSGSTTNEDDDVVLANGHVNGGPISDSDIRALLAQEQQERRRLKAELDQERTSRSRAEATANTHQTARFDAEEQVVAARLGATDAEALTLRKTLAEALAEGRYDEAAELQDKMGELRARQLQDRNYASWLAAEKTRAQQQQQQQQQAPANEGVDLAQYSPAQRRWIKNNPDFMDDPKVRLKTFAGHQLAVAEGVEVDSPEYFELIDQTVRGGRARTEDEDPPAHRQPQRREAPDMPVSRRSPQTSQARQREYKLSADEMEAADISMPDRPVQGYTDKDGNWVPGKYEAYAVNRAKIRAQGRG